MKMDSKHGGARQEAQHHSLEKDSEVGAGSFSRISFLQLPVHGWMDITYGQRSYVDRMVPGVHHHSLKTD